MREIKNIAIAGAGTMGYSMAQAFAKFGYPVKLYDLFPAALEKAIADAKAVNKDKYTDDSVAAMEKALAEAEKILADPLATQDKVDAATKTLRDAISALKPIETVSPGTGDEGVALFGMLAVISVLGMAVLVQNKRRAAR